MNSGFRLNKNMKNLTIILMLLVCASCSLVNGLPSESDARDFYYKSTQTAVDAGQFKINSFKKTNGEESADKRTYTLYYEAEIEILKDFKMTAMFQSVEYKAGDKKIIKGQYRYRKTDNGWKMLNDYGQIIE